MDDNVLDLNVAEGYWEASAAAFMACYEQLPEPRVQSSGPPPIPEALAGRALKTIRRAKLRYYLKKTVLSLKKIGTYAAVLALAVLVAGGGFQIVQAERARFRETEASPFFQLVDDEWLISSSLIPDYRYEGEIMPVGINEEDPLEGLLPEGYVLDFENQHMTDHGFVAVYNHPDGGRIFTTSANLSGNNWISAYNAQYMAHISVCGYPGIIVIDECGIGIAWVCEKTQKVFVLQSSDLPKADVIDMATEMAKHITK